MATVAAAGVFQTALAGGVSNISFSTLSADLGRTMYKYSFRLPPYYTLLVRSLSVLEGIALASDPNYKVGGLVSLSPTDCAVGLVGCNRHRPWSVFPVKHWPPGGVLLVLQQNRIDLH